MVSERIRRLGKVGVIVSFGLWVFATVFYVTLPFDRIKDYLAGEVSSLGYEMEARHAGPSLGVGMALKDVSLVSRASGTGKPTRILINKATLGLSLLSFVGGTRAVTLSADLFGGDVDVKLKLDKSETSAQSTAMEIDLAEIPWVKNAINLPLSGKLNLKLDLTLPKQRLSEAKGLLSWACRACAVGDGKAKLVIASNPLLAEGLGLPKIRLGEVSGKVAIDKGVGRLQGVQFKSLDAEATVEGEIHLAQPAATSRVDLYVRFKLSDSLLRSSEKLRTIMDFTAQMGKRPDGFIGFRMTGTFQNMSSVQWLQTSPFASGASPAKPTPPVRPALGAPPPPLAAASPASPAPIPIPEILPPAPPPPAPAPPPPAPAPPPPAPVVVAPLPAPALLPAPEPASASAPVPAPPPPHALPPPYAPPSAPPPAASSGGGGPPQGPPPRNPIDNPPPPTESL